MSIFTPVQKAEAQTRFEELVEKSIKVKQGTESRMNHLFDLMWTLKGDKPEDMTEQEWVDYQTSCMVKDQAVLDLYGTDAVQLFQWHGAAQQLMATDPDYTPVTPPYDYTANEDGTVTLSLKEAE